MRSNLPYSSQVAPARKEESSLVPVPEVLPSPPERKSIGDPFETTTEVLPTTTENAVFERELLLPSHL